MLWRGRRQSSNIEDARGQGGGGGLPGGFGDSRVRIPMGRGGRAGGGIGGIIILVVSVLRPEVLRHRPDADPRWRRRSRTQAVAARSARPIHRPTTR